jgi:hypothetical protein
MGTKSSKRKQPGRSPSHGAIGFCVAGCGLLPPLASAPPMGSPCGVHWAARSAVYPRSGRGEWRRLTKCGGLAGYLYVTLGLKCPRDQGWPWGIRTTPKEDKSGPAAADSLTVCTPPMEDRCTALILRAHGQGHSWLVAPAPARCSCVVWSCMFLGFHHTIEDWEVDLDRGANFHTLFPIGTSSYAWMRGVWSGLALSINCESSRKERLHFTRFFPATGHGWSKSKQSWSKRRRWISPAPATPASRVHPAGCMPLPVSRYTPECIIRCKRSADNCSVWPWGVRCWAKLWKGQWR